MSLHQFFRILWAHRLIILLVTFACLLGAAIIVKLTPPRYEAHSRVMLDVMRPDPVTGEVIANSFARAYTKTQTELITDYSFAGRVVDDLGWIKSPVFQKAYAAQARPGDGGLRRWLAQSIANGTYVNVIPATAILDITYSSTSPDAARKVNEAIRQAYVKQSIALRREGAAANAEWFRRQGESLRQQLAAAQQRKTAFEKANNVVLQDDWSDADSSRLKALSNQVPMTMPGVSAVPQASPSQAQLAQIDQQIVTMSQTLGPNHPDLVAMRNSRAAVAANAAREQASAMAVARAANPGGPNIEGQVSAQQSRVLAKREQIDELRKMQASIDIMTEQLKKIMTRAGDLDIEAASNESGLTLLGGATAPASPTWPNIPLMLGAALGGGLGLGLLIALAMELIGPRVRGVEDLSQTGIPVIGIIGNQSSSNHRKTWRDWIGLTRPAAI